MLRKGHIGVSFYFIFSGSVFVNVEELLTKTGHVMWHTAITLYRGDSFGVSNDIPVSKIIAFQKVNSLEVLSSLRKHNTVCYSSNHLAGVLLEVHYSIF